MGVHRDDGSRKVPEAPPTGIAHDPIRFGGTDGKDEGRKGWEWLREGKNGEQGDC
jgi:hypothetical protein